MKEKLDKILNYFFIFLIYGVIGWIYEVSWYLIVEHRFVNRGVLFGPLLPIYGFGILILLFCLKKFMQKKHLLNNIFYNSIATMTVVTFVYTTFVEYMTPKIYSVAYYLNNYGFTLFLLNIIFVVIVNVVASKVKDFGKVNVTPILVFLLIWVITTTIEYVSHFAIDKCTGQLLWDYSHDFLNINARVNWDASRNFAIGGTLLLYLVQPFIDKFLSKISFNDKKVLAAILFVPLIVDVFVNIIF